MRHVEILAGAALLVCVTGCANDPPPRARTEGELQALIKADSLDPWPHFQLAQLLEGKRKYPDAITHYGHAINKLPPRSATRPVLALGILHHRLQNADAARRCYGEVLETVASDGRFYTQNDDFKVAAIGLGALLAAQEGQDAKLEAVRKRFRDEFGGTDEDWERGPTWIRPLAPPEEEAEEASPKSPEENGR